MDPFDYAPVLGGTVTIGGMMRAQAGTAGKAVPPHIPIGGVFVKPPSHESEVFMGSKTVEVDGDAMSRLGVMVLSCQSIGMPPPPRKKVKTHDMVLPLSVVLSIPLGQVMVGGPLTISLMAIGMRAGMAALGKIGKGLRRLQRGGGRIGRAMKSMSSRMRKAAGAAMDKLGVPPSIQNRVNRAICSVTGHPVDIATGKVFTESVDFELPGPIPFKWERVYYSTSTYIGPLGYGWHHSYDMGLIVDNDAGAVIMRMNDGRPVAFPKLNIGNEYFDRTEKLTLFRDDKGYAIRTSELQIYRFNPLRGETEEQPLTSVEDLSGNRIQFIYDEEIYLREIIDSGGRTLRIETDNNGRITAMSAQQPDKPDQWFYVVKYFYDNDGDLVTVFDALNQGTRYKYENHLLTQETDRNGLSFYFTYMGSDNTAKCIRTWGDKGIYDHKLTFVEAEAFTIVENSLGYKTHHYWNNSGLVTQVVDARGGVSYTEYNEFNEKISETDSLGNVTSYTYDDYGNQTEIVGPDGAVIKVKYDKLMNPIEAVDAIEGDWRWEYDDIGRLKKRTNPLGEETAYEYSGKRLSGFLDPLGGYTGLSFDIQGNLTGIKTADGAGSLWQYDALGRATAAIDPKGNMQLRYFDLLGRVNKVQEPDGNLRLLKYDPEGNVIHAKDKQHDVKFAYSGMGRMVSRSEAETTVTFAYDTEEQLIGIKNEHGFVYKFQLDENGEVTVESGFDDVRRVYSRDAADRVESVQRASGLVTSYRYDPAGRVIAVEHSDGSAESYKYRLDGELEEAVNNTTTVKFERDVLGRITREWQGEDHWVASEYNPVGLRSQMSSSLGAIQEIERNIMGDVSRISYKSDHQNQENNQVDWEVYFKRDLMGLELERQLPGGIRSRWKRDKLGRPIQHHILDSDKALRDVRYVWDVNDRLRQVIDAHKGVTKYQHDALGNLAAAQYGDGIVELRMPDAVGNLFKTKERADRKYGQAGQLLESYSLKGTTFYEYDAEGNLIGKKEPDGGEWHYHWNATGMLDHVVRPDQDVVRFAYDALGRRTSKTFQGKITHWVWYGNNPLHEWVESLASDIESDQKAIPTIDEASTSERVLRISHPSTGPPSDNVSTSNSEYELGSNNLVNVPKNGMITWLFEPESFVPVAKIVDGKKYSIVTDYLGTPVAMLDQTGKKVWSADISVYGELRNLEGEKRDCPFRWPGQYEDEETGLYYNRFRYYDCNAGTYISQDPVGLAGNIPNLYAYVHDTNSWIDVFGLTGINEGGQSVYGLFKPGATEPYYIGISNNAATRELQHIDSGRLTDGELRVLRDDLTYAEARGREQALIEKHKTKTGTIGEDIGPNNQGNKINSFDKTRTDARGKAFNAEYKKFKAKGCH